MRGCDSKTGLISVMIARSDSSDLKVTEPKTVPVGTSPCGTFCELWNLGSVYLNKRKQVKKGEAE